MKKKKFLILSTIVLILIIGIKLIFFSNVFIFRFSPSTEVRFKYINAVDKVSSGKAQINWREVMAVDATFNYGKVETATEKNIENLANRFLIKDKNEYKIVSMKSVVKELNGQSSEVKKTNNYLKVINKQRDDPKNKTEVLEKKLNFTNSIKDEAISISKETGILPSVIIGQAALESNWGKSELSSKYNNLFGIKADPSWSGKKVNLTTSEYYNSKIKDEFRVYESVGESLKDFGKFLKENPRYTKAGVFKAKTYKEQIKAIENAGYSTITNEKGEKVYANYVEYIIMSNDLQLLDWSLKRQ